MKEIKTDSFIKKQATDTFNYVPVSGVPGNIFKSHNPKDTKKNKKKKKKLLYQLNRQVDDVSNEELLS